MRKKSKYFSYRYFLVSASRTKLLFQERRKSKNEVITELKNILNKKVKITKEYKQRKYLLYFIRELAADLYLLKLARERHYNKHEEGEKDIKTEEDVEFPYIYVIMDFKKQIILIQKKTSTFNKVSTSYNVLQNIINSNVDFGQYIFTIDEISHKELFWQLVEKSKKIYSLKLRLRAPNLFGGRFEANEFLKEEQRKYNVAEIDVEYKNEHGELIVDQENMDSYINYISAGGGSYRLRFKADGEVKTKSSKDNIKTTYLAKEINDFNIAQIKAELEKIDNLVEQNEK